MDHLYLQAIIDRDRTQGRVQRAEFMHRDRFLESIAGSKGCVIHRETLNDYPLVLVLVESRVFEYCRAQQHVVRLNPAWVFFAEAH